MQDSSNFKISLFPPGELGNVLPPRLRTENPYCFFALFGISSLNVESETPLFSFTMENLKST